AVTYASSDEAVATVDANGKITAIAAGSADVTVTTADGGKTDKCAVTVTAP
ncbi:major capsid protein, partial [Bacillus thuringiensis]